MNPNIIPAVIRQESGGNPNALSPKGAAGVMQIMPDTARDPGFGVTPLQGWDGLDPRTAPVGEQVRFGTDYLNAMAQHFGGDTRLALAAYNAGPGAVEQAGGVPNYPETKNYVQSITGGTQVAADDWRARAAPVATSQTSDWRSRAQSVDTSSDWRSRAQPAKAPDITDAPGEDMGAGAAALQGFNSAIPFGERITAGLGAVGATAVDKLAGIQDPGIAGNYEQIRANQKATSEANPLSYGAGAVTGVAASLPLASTKVIGGGQAAATGIRGAVNAIPEALSSVGNFVRGSKVASDAGTVAKAANLAGKAVRGAAVAAPAGAAYSYGSSEHDLNSPEAISDAATGAELGAATGGALPVIGAAASKVIPKIGEEAAGLAKIAKERFNIDLSLDQLSPSRVRSTVQKVSQELPGSGVGKFQDTQKQQWMKGVAGTIGEHGSDNLGPEVITKYLERASADFDSALSGKTIKIEPQDLNGIQDIATRATRKVTGDVAQVVKNNVDDFISDLDKFKVGDTRTIPGEKLASLRSKIIRELPSIDSQAREHVGDIIDKIDEIIGRHLTQKELDTLSTARLQWRNFRTLEPLLEKSTDGSINPTQLMQRVASSKFIKASRTETGKDDLVDLARIGKQFLGAKGGSDTVPKLLISGGTLGNVALAAAAPAAAVPALLAQGGAMLANRGYQKLVNQSPRLAKAAVNQGVPQLSSKAAPISAMLSAQGSAHTTPRSRRK